VFFVKHTVVKKTFEYTSQEQRNERRQQSSTNLEDKNRRRKSLPSLSSSPHESLHFENKVRRSRSSSSDETHSRPRNKYVPRQKVFVVETSVNQT